MKFGNSWRKEDLAIIKIAKVGKASNLGDRNLVGTEESEDPAGSEIGGQTDCQGRRLRITEFCRTRARRVTIKVHCKVQREEQLSRLITP